VLTCLAVLTPILVVLASHAVADRTGHASDGPVIIAMATTGLPDTELSPTGRAYLVPLAEVDDDLRLAATSTASATASTGPVRPMLWYREAAATHGVSPYLLEALHQVETSVAPDGCWSNIEGSGATGPFQFKHATFRRYGLDTNHDGVTDICAFSDSLMSAAHYLHALGADARVDSTATYRALVRYGTDADRVVELARFYSAR
jgi:hypothetical protein